MDTSRPAVTVHRTPSHPVTRPPSQGRTGHEGKMKCGEKDVGVPRLENLPLRYRLRCEWWGVGLIYRLMCEWWGVGLIYRLRCEWWSVDFIYRLRCEWWALYTG